MEYAEHQLSMSPYGVAFGMERDPLLRAAAVFGTLATRLQDSLPRWEEAAEAGAKAVGTADAVTAYQDDVLRPLMQVLRAIDGSVGGFSRALSGVVTTYTDADDLGAREFSALATGPVADA